MNDMTTTGTALALPEATSLEALLKSDEGPKTLLDQIKEAARAAAKDHDAKTSAGRRALISLANKASQSRAEATRQAKAITEQWRKDTAAVNAGRKVLEDGLAELRDEIRAPVTAWEAAEEKRKAAHVEAMAVFDCGASSAMDAPEDIRAALAAVEAAPLGECWEEFEEEAAEKRRIALDWHRNNLAVAEKRVADEAELARLRAEAAERERKEAEEAERKAAAERAERERKEAEERRIEAEKAEAARREQAERDKAEAAERARVEAEERAKAETKAAEERHQRELAEAKAREERAAQAERDRIEAERKRAAEARAKREADEAHRARIKADIVEALTTMRGAATPEAIADALMAGRIPHVQVTL